MKKFYKKFIQENKIMIEDKEMWGWLMVFAGIPFIVFGWIFESSFDWAIYASYVGGTLVVVGFIWGAIRSG